MQELLPSLELVFQDESGSIGAVTFHLKAGSTVADADVALTSVASVLLPLTNAVLIRTRVTYRKVTLVPGAAASGSSIKRAGIFILNTVDDTHLCLINIPSIAPVYIVTTGTGSGILIDTANSDVTAFVDALVTNGTVDPFSVATTSLLTAYRQSRI